MGFIIFIAVIAFVALLIYAANSQNQPNLPPQSTTRYPRRRSIQESTITEPPITIDVGESDDDIEAILKKLIEDDIKDQVTGENFKPGEGVYFCTSHKLAFHEDSWEFLGRKCSVCNHSHHASFHILPNLTSTDTDINIIWNELTDNTNHVRGSSSNDREESFDQGTDIDITWIELTDDK